METTNNYFSSFSFWSSSYPDMLQESEKELLSLIQSEYKQYFVTLPDDVQINTLQISFSGGPPLLLLHGYGSGLGQWVKNFDHLAKHYTIYACDVVGFARSSRIPCNFNTPEDAENYFTKHIHQWIEALNLDYFILCGHSLGGYLSTVYQIKYNNNRCKKLILADPWGFPKMPEVISRENESWRLYLITNASGLMSPFSFLRLTGATLGKSLMAHFRSDLVSKFNDAKNPEVFINYIFYLNSKSPAPGEDAFQMLKIPFAWAKLPLVDRFGDLDPSLPVSFIYGRSTWMNKDPAYELRQKFFQERKIDIYEISSAGHHVMLDNADEFNERMQMLCNNFRKTFKSQLLDNNKNLGTLGKTHMG